MGHRPAERRSSSLKQRLVRVAAVRAPLHAPETGDVSGWPDGRRRGGPVLLPRQPPGRRAAPGAVREAPPVLGSMPCHYATPPKGACDVRDGQ